MTARAMCTSHETAQRLFAPRSVAIVGASLDPEKLSSKPLENLVRLGYEGTIYPVNPRATEIAGLRCYPTLAELPETPDVAFVVLPARQSVEAVRECGRLGVPVAVVAVSGFAESGTDEGMQLQARLGEIARETGTRIVGPNCNGFYNARLRVSLGYNAAHAEVITPGPLTAVSHSGALFSTIAGRAKALDLGLGIFVSVGNEADLTLLDFFEWAIDDPECRVIGLLIEAIRDGHRFRNLAARARERGKPVVALKFGISELGRAVTAAHSSRLAGAPRAYEALFAQAGVVRVTTVEGLVAAARLLVDGAGAVGGGLAAVTTTGAGGALLADAAAGHRVPFAALGAESEAALASFRRFAPVLNPVDVGATGTEHTESLARTLASDPGVGALALYSTGLLRAQSRRNVARGMCAARQDSGKPTVVLAPGGVTDEERRTYRDARIPVFEDTATCFEALAALLQRPVGGGLPSSWPGPRRPVPREAVEALRAGRPLNEPESLRLLETIGIPVVRHTIVHDEQEAMAAVRRIGWPVVAKGISRAAAHKSRMGLVRLGLSSEVQLHEAVQSIRERAAAAHLALEGVLVQRQLQGSAEVLLGLTEEPGLGMFLIAGIGGVHAEILGHTAIWPVPVAAEDLQHGLRASVVGRLLESVPARFEDQLVDIMLSLQELAEAARDELAAIDINPLLLTVEGPVAVDALVIPRTAAVGSTRQAPGR